MRKFSLLLIAATCLGQNTPDTFLRLRDTPDTYSGQALKSVRVNAAANALEFATIGGGAFTDLTDVPSSYTGQAGKALRVNVGETGLEFFTAAGSGTVTSVGLVGTTNQITVTGASPITASGSWTLSVPTAARLDIARLTNLTTNGFVTTSGGVGTLGVDTSTYLTGNQTITLSSDVTGSGTTSIATTIANDAVTLAKMANMATDSIIGRATASTGDPEVLTSLPFAFTGDVTRAADSNAQTIATDAVTTAKILDANVTLAKIENIATDSIIGRATASAGVPEVLTALPFAFTGDVTRSADSNATTIANDAVTFAKFQNISTDVILGRKTALSGDMEELTALPFALTGDVTTVADANATTIAADAVTYSKMQNVSAASKLLGRGDSGAGDPQEITIGTNLTMTGTTLSASGGGGAPGGSNTQVQFNDSSAFGGDSGLTFDKTNNILTLTGLAANGTLLKLDPGAATAAGDINNASSQQGIRMFAGTAYTSSPAFQLWGDSSSIKGAYFDAGNVSGADILFRGDSGGSSPQEMRIFSTSSGHGVVIGTSTTAPGAGILDVGTGFRIGGVAASGKIPIGNGTNYVASTPTYPNAAGTSGYVVRSDGTNFASYPTNLSNASTANQSFTTSDTYVTGSDITVTAGDFKAKGQYRCVIAGVKTAGTGAIVISLRVGTAGTTSDAAILTFTFGAGTTVGDTATFVIAGTFRTVGSGTSAVMEGVCQGQHNLATTGFFNNAASFTIISGPSSGFNSSTATKIGVSFNGSTAFSGTVNLVQATLDQP